MWSGVARACHLSTSRRRIRQAPGQPGGRAVWRTVCQIWPPGLTQITRGRKFLSLYSDTTREVILRQNTWGHRADIPKVYLMFRPRQILIIRYFVTERGTLEKLKCDSNSARILHFVCGYSSEIYPSLGF